MKVIKRYGCKFEVPDEELTHCPVKLLGYLMETLKPEKEFDEPEQSQVQLTHQFLLELAKVSEVYRKQAIELTVAKYDLKDDVDDLLDNESQAWAIIFFGPRKPENDDGT